ncbi:GNAT family N-acetyltransferase [Tengunoibacter tsumagoiensis]|uniref:N-acetyltransferase domain-containing protein n=1 Tax=Tengunoibacter tsumagoiensis TaxID=2014871 RepID=A0A402A9X7_9CHLR|nr:GNAT family N-acetyltransferase [Tengunoibacter tsumagoiensis]GCE15984.1 hypothetical protein KTT_58430 [Tengunoibacter tsumagoiensis]
MKSEIDLLRLHLEAVWDIRLPPLVQTEVELLPTTLLPPWQLCLAELTSGWQVAIWRSKTSALNRKRMLQQAQKALALPEAKKAPPGISREVALIQTASPTMDLSTAHQHARLLTEQDQNLLEAFQPGGLDYYLHLQRRPLIGTIVDGRLLSLAHSSRRTTEVCELGIDTLPEARRKGYALAATLVWAQIVASEGLIPIYSALSENEPSLRLAAAAGYRPFARSVKVESGIASSL